MANSPGTSTNAFSSILKNSNNNNNNNNNNNGVINKFFNTEKNNISSIANINKSFRAIIKDGKRLDEAAHYLYRTLIDDTIVAVYLEMHNLLKSGNLNALEGVLENDSTYRIIDTPNYDIFGISTAKKPMDCICPNCDRPVSASRFAPHLEKCMGMGRISSRIASRRLATKEVNSASSSSSSSYQQPNANSDDEDDMEWASEKRRKKSNQNSRNNGSKKNNGKSF